MKMTASNLVIIFLTVLLVKCPAEETKTVALSGWIEDLLKESENNKWTGKSISSLKNNPDLR